MTPFSIIMILRNGVVVVTVASFKSPEVVESIVSSSSGFKARSELQPLKGCASGGEGVAAIVCVTGGDGVAPHVDWLKPDGVCDVGGGGFQPPGTGNRTLRLSVELLSMRYEEHERCMHLVRVFLFNGPIWASFY